MKMCLKQLLSIFMINKLIKNVNYRMKIMSKSSLINSKNFTFLKKEMSKYNKKVKDQAKLKNRNNNFLQDVM